MACHQTCQTCTAQLFSNCASCPANMLLFQTSCVCQTSWQAQCTSQSNLRQLFMFLDMIMTLAHVGLMVMYAVRARLPFSYRIFSGINSLSLLIYSPAFYLQYQDFFSLKTLSHTNGPYLSLFRSTEITKEVYLFPTMTIAICLVVMIFLFFPVYSTFINSHDNFIDYLQESVFKYFDTFYFICSRMMFMCIGKAINQFVVNGFTGDILVPVIILAVFGIICILAIVRNMILYHREESISQIYPTPLYLYTVLSPIAMIGLCLITNPTLLLIVYCSPIALLLLIILLNRGIKIFTKTNTIFYVIEILYIGMSVGYILFDDTAKSYLIIAIDLLSLILILIETLRLYYGGINLGDIRVHPQDVPDYQKEKKKQIYGDKNQGDNNSNAKSNYGSDHYI